MIGVEIVPPKPFGILLLIEHKSQTIRLVGFSEQPYLSLVITLF